MLLESNPPAKVFSHVINCYVLFLQTIQYFGIKSLRALFHTLLMVICTWDMSIDYWAGLSLKDEQTNLKKAIEGVVAFTKVSSMPKRKNK